MSERERFEEHAVGVNWTTRCKERAFEAWQARARIAEQREAELVEALKEISETTCTGQEAGRIARNALAKHESNHETK